MSVIVIHDAYRICQGRFFADATAWLAIANVLAVFDILPAVDPMSNEEVAPRAEFLSGFTRQVSFSSIIGKVSVNIRHIANQSLSYVVSSHVACTMQH